MNFDKRILLRLRLRRTGWLLGRSFDVPSIAKTSEVVVVLQPHPAFLKLVVTTNGHRWTRIGLALVFCIPPFLSLCLPVRLRFQPRIPLPNPPIGLGKSIDRFLVRLLLLVVNTFLAEAIALESTTEKVQWPESFA